MRKIRIAQIGVSMNSHGREIFRNLTSQPELFEIAGYARRQLVVTGTKKTVELRPLEMTAGKSGPLLYTDVTEYSSAAWPDMGVTRRSEIYNRYSAMMAGFAAMCRGERENPWSCGYELTLYRTLLRACGVTL